MTTSNFAEKQLIRVICEACRQEHDASCQICGGTKFYFWDPASRLCYTADGAPLTAENGAGERVNVVREAHGKPHLDLATTLSFIEIWVSEAPVRKWKLWIDAGWNCCVWTNQYTEKGRVFASKDPTTCVTECYDYILSLISNSHS